MWYILLLLLTIASFCLADDNIIGEGVTENDVTLYLFKKGNPEQFTIVSKENATGTIDKNAITVFIVHGYMDDRTVGWYEQLKNAFFSQSQLYEVIEVDWHKPANNPLYLEAAKATVPVGNIIGDLVTSLINNGYDVSNFRLVGHSLGAHVVGFAAKRVNKQSGRKLPFIEGFDPAGPGFTGNNCNERLCESDAEQVVALHTNYVEWGNRDILGTVDIFANGGGLQPGCPDSTKNILSCSHSRSYIYGYEALQKKGSFIARKCPNYNDAVSSNDGRRCRRGQRIDIADIPADARGIYELRTNYKEPFGRASKFLKF